MRWLTTVLLLILAAAGGAYVWKGDVIRGRLGVGTPTAAAASPSVDRLTRDVTPDAVKGITLTGPAGDPVVLTRAGAAWAMPGNWPVRQADANALAAALTSLKTRFRPAALASDADLSKYGLAADQKPVTAKLDLGGRVVTLTFGRPPAGPDESPFARPTFGRVDNEPEVLRLPADLFAELARSPDDYRRKQLFPDAVKVKVEGGTPPPNPLNPAAPPPAADGDAVLLGDSFTGVKVDAATGGFVLARTAPTPRPDADAGLPVAKLADAWAVREVAAKKGEFKPLPDRPDPAKLRGVLAAVPDLWAERFVTGKSLDECGLKEPDRGLTVTKADGTAVTLRVGKLARRVEKDDGPPPPPPSPFGPPPTAPPKKVEEFYYAKLDDNPLVFEIRGDKLGELFIVPDDLRDAQLARFESNDVTELTVAAKGKPVVRLTKKKGNKDADRDEDKQDRWYVGDILAEGSRVTELLDQLSRLEAKNPAPPVPGVPPEPAVLDGADAKKLEELGLAADATTVTVVTREKVPAGQADPAPRSVAFRVGKHDAEKKKLNVQVAGNPRVNVVADDAVKLIDRPALAYRGRRLFDTADAKLTGVAVTQAGGEAFALQQDANTWKLTKPLAVEADAAKAAQVTGDLARLEVTEYVDDAPKPEDLDKKYGLTPAKLTVDLTFTGPGAKPEKLEVGGSPEFKDEYYARRNGGGSVFTLPKAAVDAVKAGAVGLLPLQLWSVPPEKITGVAVTRADGEAYKLAADGVTWKLTGPFDAAVPYPSAMPVLAALANVRADKYESLTADPVKHGFDKPALRVAVTYKEPKPGDAKAEDAVTRTLLVGKPTADGATTRFARLDGGPNQAVFVVPDQLVKDADKPALDLLDKALLSADPGRVSKLTIAGPAADANVTLTKDDKGGWKADGATFMVDRPTADEVLFAFARPQVRRLAGYGPNVKWAEYGLDKPAWTITGELGGEGPLKAETHAIKLGSVADGRGRYARIDDGPALAVLAPASADVMSRGRLDFVDHTLLAFEAAALNGFTRRDATDAELSVEPAATTGWDITAPVKLKADQALMDELAEQLSKLRAGRVAAYGPGTDLAKYGLLEPAAAVTLTVGVEKPEKKVLLLGAPVEPAKPDGERYVMAEGARETTVGVLNGFLSRRLLGSPLKFRDRSLAKFVDADRAVLERGDRKAVFAKVDGVWKQVEPIKGDAEQGNEAGLDGLVSALGQLRADELEADKPADLTPFGLAKPEAKWRLLSGDKEVLSLHVGRVDDDRAFAKLEKGDVVAKLDLTVTKRVLGEYRKRAVWAGVDASQIETVAVSGGANFGLRKLGQLWVDTSNAGAAIEQPKVSEFLDALAGLKAERYAVDQGADLKLYGLAPPQRVVVLTQRGGVTKMLHLGREEGGSGGKRVYARADEAGRTDVFVLSEADTAKLTRDRAAFAGKK